jgi:hypothetical protein
MALRQGNPVLGVPPIRHVLNTKGVYGPRDRIFKSKTEGKRSLWLIGVDGIKTELASRLKDGRGIHFSNTLSSAYFDQLSSEHQVVVKRHGQLVDQWERVSHSRRNEAWDCLVYAYGVRAWLRVMPEAFNAIEQRLKSCPMMVTPALDDTNDDDDVALFDVNGGVMFNASQAPLVPTAAPLAAIMPKPVPMRTTTVVQDRPPIQRAPREEDQDPDDPYENKPPRAFGQGGWFQNNKREDQQ